MRGVVGGVILGLCAAMLALGGRIPVLAPVTGLLHATALPVVMIIVCFGAACSAAFLALWSPERRTGTWVFSALAGCTAVVLVVLQVAAGPGRHAESAAPAAGTRIRVVQANVLMTNTDYSAVFERAGRADVVALAEADPGIVRAGLTAYGIADRFAVLVNGPAIGPETMLLVRRGLGPRSEPAAALPFAAVGARTNAGRFVAVHTASPVARSPWQSEWQTTVAAAAAQCRPDTVVAGDYNATWPQLRPRTACGDAADALHMGAAGSWRSSWPAWFGARIDHQLYDPGALTPVSADLFDVPGSDHRGTDIVYARTGGADVVR